MNAATLPDMCHVKRRDAEDLAAEIIGMIEQLGRLVVYLQPNGTLHVSEHLLDIAGEFSLVGVYDDEATQKQIADDILAMQREPIHGGA